MGLLTAYFSLMGVSDATYKRIECNLSALSMDANNVQKLPAVFTLMDTYGATVGTFAAYLRLQVMNREAVLDTISYSTLQSSLTYTLPADKYGIATGIRLTAYEDKEFTKEICHTSVSIVRENPTPFPRSEDWSADLTYKNGEYLMQDNIVYMWTNPIAGNSTVAPKTDIQQHPDTTSWKSYQEWPLLASQVFLAKWAKLGSSIFDGDYTFSQHGKDAGGNDTGDYRQFDPTKIGQSDCPFTPNLMIDWLLGKLTANDVFLKGVIEAVSGKIAGFEIDGNNLSNAEGRDCWISINYKDGTKTRVAALGNNLPSELGFSTSGYHEESGTDENRAMVLRAKGSNFPRGYYLRNSNFAIDAYGGCLWDMDENDFLCIPGLLFVCEVTTTADKTVSIARQFGDGCGHVESSYNIGLREYYFDLEHMHNNIYPLPVASYQRESGAYAGSTGSYNISGNRITVVFWEGAGKVYPQKFTLFILGRPAIK